jgi:hypothetical protein
MKGMVHIRKPVLYNSPGPRNMLMRARGEGAVEYRPVSGVSCSIDVTKADGSSDTRTVWFEVDSKYREGLCDDLCDAYVIGLLHYCLRNHYDIESDAPMSEELYYNLTEQLIPVLVKNDFRLSEIEIRCDTIPDDKIRRGRYIGTSASSGVDSLYTLHKHADHPSKSLRLTHVCLNNVGSFIGSYGRGDDYLSNVSQIYQRSQDLANMVGLPIVESDSNFSEAFPQNHLLSHLYSSMFAVFVLRYHWRKYFYPSAGHGCATISFENNSVFDPARYEPLALSIMSTARLKLYSDGFALMRNEKLRDISKYRPAQKYLHSCLVSGTNCGLCGKCQRNLFGLDAMGLLDNFKEAYDLDYYYANRKRFIVHNIAKDDEYTMDSKRIFIQSKSRIYQECLEISKKVNEAIRSLEEGRSVDDALATLEENRYFSNRALFTLAKHYMASEDEKTRKKGLEYLIKGKDDENPDAVMYYIQYLSKKTDKASRKEMADLCLKHAIRGNPRAQHLMAKMQLEGVDVEKDHDSAMRWLRLSASRYRPAMTLLYEELCKSDAADDKQEAEKVKRRMDDFDRRYAHPK